MEVENENRWMLTDFQYAFLATCVLVVRKGVRSVYGEFRRTIILNVSFLQPHDGIARIPDTEMIPYVFIIFDPRTVLLLKRLKLAHAGRNAWM